MCFRLFACSQYLGEVIEIHTRSYILHLEGALTFKLYKIFYILVNIYIIVKMTFLQVSEAIELF